MEKEELDALVLKIKGNIEEGDSTLKSELVGLIDEMSKSTLKADALNDFTERLSAMELKANKPVEKVVAKSFMESLEIALKDNEAAIDSVTKGESIATRLEIKAVGNVTSSNISGGDIPQADRMAGFGLVPSRKVRLFELMSQRSTSSDKFEWVYQSGKEGTAGATGEGLAKNQIDFNWVVGSEDMQKITAYIKVTTEMLAKGEVAQAINQELLQEVYKAAEGGAYSGAGTTIYLNGVYTVATAFSAATAGSTAIVLPNTVDVLATAMTQINIAQEGEATANVILMNPSDVLQLKLQKITASDKRYVGRLLDAGSGLMVDGVRIVETTLVTAGTYLVGDFTKAIWVQREGMNIEIGYDADDFTKNLRTIRAELRGAVAVPNNSRTAFVKGVIATDIAALAALT